VKRFRPQHLQDGYFLEIKDQLTIIFYEEVLKPVARVIKEYNPQKLIVENAAISAIKRALLSGMVQYSNGRFSGQFSTAISRDLRSLGAKFSKWDGTYRLAADKLPKELRDAASQYSLQSKLVHQAIEGELNRAVESALGKHYDIDAQDMVAKVDAGWRRSAAQLEVKPELTEAGKKAMAAQYSTNLDLYIKKWLNEQILALRKDVQANAEAGYRFDRLIDKIQRRKEVSESKARFLARQETGLFMSNYRAQRFQDAGITKYKWSTAHDARVRPEASLTPAQRRHAGNHRILHGMTFTYADKAPAKYMSVGRPCNPGEDYQCLPGDSGIDFGGGIEKCFRRWYDGELTTLILESGKAIRATPNHPVLTLNGWKPVCLVDNSDHLVDLSEDLRWASEAYGDERITTIRQIFESCRESGLGFSFPGQREQFHGDGSNSNVDIIDATRSLHINWQSDPFKRLSQFVFSAPDYFTSRSGGAFQPSLNFLGREGLSIGHGMRSRTSRSTEGLSFIECHARESQAIGFRSSTNSNICFKEPA
jgi:SPP1 gp7 family putative phage head morphogenesis protein